MFGDEVSGPDEGVQRLIAPDSSLVVELEAVEWGNTRWVMSPRVTEMATGLALLDLWGTDWDASVAFPRARAVRLQCRRYRQGGVANVELGLDDRRFLLFGSDGVTSGSFDMLPEAMAGAAAASAVHTLTPAVSTSAALRGRAMSAVLALSAITLVAAAGWVALHPDAPGTGLRTGGPRRP